VDPGATCPLRPVCTTSPRGRTIAIYPHEAVLQQARQQQRDPAWHERYRTGRPIVERKISQFTRRAWGGRKPRGLARITTDLCTAPEPSTVRGSLSSASNTTKRAGRSGPLSDGNRQDHPTTSLRDTPAFNHPPLATRPRLGQAWRA
jgi:Transposase DDE domain